MGHNYQRQVMNSETQFRTTLTNVYYRQVPGKVMEVERIKERKKKKKGSFFDGSGMKYREFRICDQTHW